MRLPMFFQKQNYTFHVLGLPGMGKKLFLSDSMTTFRVERGNFKIQIEIAATQMSDLQEWEHGLTQRLGIASYKKEILPSALVLEFPDRVGMDKLLEQVLNRNGGISQNTALPEELTWNPESYPVAKPCPKGDGRFQLFTSEGRWFLSFRPLDLGRNLNPKYPEDVEKVKTICKKKGIEIHPVTYLPNQFEFSKEDWDSFAEAILI